MTFPPSLLTVEKKNLSHSSQRHLIQVMEELMCREQYVSYCHP